MPSVGGVRFDPNREGLADLCNCCLLTEAHPLEQIPGWQNEYDDRTKMSKEEEEARGRLGQHYPLAWYMVKSEPAAHRCDRLWSLATFFFLWFFEFFFLPVLPYYLLSFPSLFPQTHTPALYTVIHPSCPQCFQERQIKEGILISFCHTWAAGLMNHNKFY